MPLDSRTTRALSVVLNEATTAQMTENTRLKNEVASMRRNLNDRWLLDVLHLIDQHNDGGFDGVEVHDANLDDVVSYDRLVSIGEMSQEEKQRILPTLCEMGFDVLRWREEDFWSIDWKTTPAKVADWVARSSGVEPCYAYHPATGPLDPRFGQRS
jgi:polyhydroxyalkanoate synthesis regulator phasin